MRASTGAIPVRSSKAPTMGVGATEEASVKGKSSPWGKIQDARELVPGAWVVHTAGHGGFKLDRKLNARVPESVRRPGGWYEEDCEWSLAVVALADVFDEKWVEQARKTAKSWYPDEYTRLTGEPVAVEESGVLIEREFQARNRDNWIALSAWGDWHEAVPKGMVGVYATIGGVRPTYGHPVESAHFLTTKERYNGRAFHGYVVQEDDQPWQGPGN